MHASNDYGNSARVEQCLCLALYESRLLEQANLDGTMKKTLETFNDGYETSKYRSLFLCLSLSLLFGDWVCVNGDIE